jgi:hypothetical protein
MAVLGVALVVATIVLGILSMVVIIVPLLPVFLALDRRVADLYRLLARRLLRLSVDRPVRTPRLPGLYGFLVYHLADSVSWRAVGYFAARFPLGVLQFAIAIAFWLYGLAFTLYPLLWQIEAASIRPRSTRRSSAS